MDSLDGGVGLSLLDWSLDPRGIACLVEGELHRARAELERIASLERSEQTFSSTAGALSDIHGRLHARTAACTFPSLVSPSEAVRKASSSAKQAIQEFFIDMNSHQGVYQALLGAKHATLEDGSLEQEDSRVLEKFLEDMERNGMGLPTAQRGKLVELRKQIGRLELEFNNNVNEDKITLTFTPDELEGMDESFLKGLETVEDPSTPEGATQKYKVSMKYPEVFPCLRKAKRARTRELLERSFNGRGQGLNEPLLAEILALRHQAANLLGHPNDAAYQLSIKMARTPLRVVEFLHQVGERLEPLRDELLRKLERMKASDALARHSPGDIDGVRLCEHDWRYYLETLKLEEFRLDSTEIQRYFPLDRVLSGTLDTYQDLLGLTFHRVEHPVRNVWHPDVLEYRVVRHHDGKMLGTFFLDLHPRQGKYSHAACFPIQLAYQDSQEDTRVLTASAMVANFTRPKDGEPALLQHSEVVTLFHEFGHVMHSICSSSRYSRLNWTWTAVEQDFLECPSMMLENWAWEPQVLDRISGHHTKDGHPPLPRDVLNRMLDARKCDQALMWSRLIGMCHVDMRLHTDPFVHAHEPSHEGRARLSAKDLSDLWKEAKHRYFGIEHTEGTSPLASWQHLTTGYNAGYYGYIWSKVISTDMYTRFQREGILSSSCGSDLRTTVLEPGCIRTGEHMLKEFLGRDYDIAPFLRSVGVDVSGVK